MGREEFCPEKAKKLYHIGMIAAKIKVEVIDEEGVGEWVSEAWPAGMTSGFYPTISHANHRT
jgi:hypothetical protein